MFFWVWWQPGGVWFGKWARPGTGLRGRGETGITTRWWALLSGPNLMKSYTALGSLIFIHCYNSLFVWLITFCPFIFLSLPAKPLYLVWQTRPATTFIQLSHDQLSHICYTTVSVKCLSDALCSFSDNWQLSVRHMYKASDRVVPDVRCFGRCFASSWQLYDKEYKAFSKRLAETVV